MESDEETRAQEELERWFGPLRWLPGHTYLDGKLREAYLLLANNLLDLTPAGEEQHQAMHRLRESLHWALQALAAQGVQTYQASGLHALGRAAEQSQSVARKTRKGRP